MPKSSRNTLKLPRQLLDEIGNGASASSQKVITRLGARKDTSKGSRFGRKPTRGGTTFAPRQTIPKSSSQPHAHQGDASSDDDEDEDEIKAPAHTSKHKVAIAEASPHILASKPDDDRRQHGRAPGSEPPKLSRAIADKLAEDDAEIKYFERALGINSKKRNPKLLDEDGLGSLLGDLRDSEDEQEVARKRGTSEDEEWLRKKRKRAKIEPDSIRARSPSLEDSFEDWDSDDLDSAGSSDVSSQLDGDDERLDFDSEDGHVIRSSSGATSESRRENPYLPGGQHAVDGLPKYVPPSLRIKEPSNDESIARLKRQTQGTLNRLSESNMLSILGEIESVYRQNPRQHVTSLLLDSLYGLLCDPSPLQDTFMILHGGFVAGLHKGIGHDFSAQCIERFVEEFTSVTLKLARQEYTGKEASNLITFLTELYNFQVIGSNLMYDYIRLFVVSLSEEYAELLLKIVKLSGNQLRHDDPSSLKDIVKLIQEQVANIGLSELSVRTKFMIETIESLKNNRLKTGVLASSIVSEHTNRMKKTLGAMRQAGGKASEPLQVSLGDIQNKDKRGKWWIVGASYHGKDEIPPKITTPGPQPLKNVDDPGEVAVSGIEDLLHLAREQRMNTDIRRSIFITLLSSSDYSDATQRILKLRLNKSQRTEIPKVIIHCVGAERAYNPYYTLISSQLCSERSIRMAFHFCLRDFMRRLDPEDEDFDNDGEEQLGLNATVNVAKTYSKLIAEGRQSVITLKNLDFPYVSSKLKVFVEILLINLLILLGGEEKYSQKVGEIFACCREAPDMAAGLLVFLRRTVMSTDLVSDSSDTKLVKKGCRHVEKILKGTSAEESHMDSG